MSEGEETKVDIVRSNVVKLEEIGYFMGPRGGLNLTMSKKPFMVASKFL